jgi:hypothetical protein
MRDLAQAWQKDKSSLFSKIGWQLTNMDARIELKHLYPKN